jgi:magnesium transporter
VQLAWDSPNHLFLSIICLPSAIITIHESSIPTLEEIETEFSSAARFRTLSTSAILYQILDHLIDEDMAFVLEVRRTIELLEEAIDMDPDSVQIEQILVVKRLVSRLSMTFEDQRHCVAALQTTESEIFNIQDFREYFRDSLSHLEYALRSIGRQQARLAEIHQHYLLTLQDKTNKRINLIAIISAIFMPLTLITGLYGMNFRFMPELQWSYSYPLVIAVMVTIAAVLLFIFQRKGWFR